MRSEGLQASPLWQLTWTRMLAFLREPEALFWVFAFPILLALALGIAFRNQGPQKSRIGVEAGPGAEAIAEALAASPDLEVQTFEPDAARRTLLEQFRTHGLEAFGLEARPLAAQAAGALVSYLRDTQKADLAHVRAIGLRVVSDALIIDPITLEDVVAPADLEAQGFRGGWSPDEFQISRGKISKSAVAHQDEWVLFNLRKLRKEIDPEGYAMVAPWRKGAGARYLIALADEPTRAGDGPLGRIREVPTTIVLDGAGRVAARFDRQLAPGELDAAIAAAARAARE